MSTDRDKLIRDIEAYLLARNDWVPTAEICARFNLPDDRALRQVDGTPGLCSDYAISGNLGLKHIHLASTTDWLKFKHRLRRHGIGELARISKLDRRRQAVIRSVKRPRPTSFEADTGQITMDVITGGSLCRQH
jgi:hypothetical protein